MFKKIVSILMIMVLVVLTACNTSKVVVLPDLTGLSQSEITSALSDKSLTPVFYIDNSIIYDNDDQYDQFVKYGADLVAGTEVDKGSEIKVYTTPLNLYPHYINELDNYSNLGISTSDYEGKNFIPDGIGEATVTKYVDGDTTLFSSGGQTFTVRYLGIDTPESTALFEPWGKAASKYTQEQLSTAKRIVLQSEGERMDGNGRYLAWVWYIPADSDQFVLLNLELVELAYSKGKVSAGSIYTDIINKADMEVSLTKRRVWGEIDPNYDYSREGTQMTIQYLMEHFDEYVGLKVSITGVVSRKAVENAEFSTSSTCYIQDENGYGLYIYTMLTFAQIQSGQHLSISALTPTYYNGSPQLTNLKEKYISVLDSIGPITPTEISYNDFSFEKIGSLVKMNHLKVVSVHTSATSDIMSINVEDSLGNNFDIRIGSAIVNDYLLSITPGSYISVTAPLGYYDYNYPLEHDDYNYEKSNFQLLLCSSDDLVIE